MRSEQEYIEALNNTQGIVVKRIRELEAELTALREGNRVALAEAYRCGYEAGKAELREELDEARKLGLYWQAEATTTSGS